MTTASPPAHVATIVDAYRWRGEKPVVFTFEHNRRSAYVVIGAASLTLTDAQPSAVSEVIVLAHIVELSTNKGSLHIVPVSGQARVLSNVNETELLGAILDRLQPPLPR
jgi:hypothetical protein